MYTKRERGRKKKSISRGKCCTIFPRLGWKKKLENIFAYSHFCSLPEHGSVLFMCEFKSDREPRGSPHSMLLVCSLTLLHPTCYVTSCLLCRTTVYSHSSACALFHVWAYYLLSLSFLPLNRFFQILLLFWQINNHHHTMEAAEKHATAFFDAKQLFHSLVIRKMSEFCVHRWHTYARCVYLLTWKVLFACMQLERLYVALRGEKMGRSEVEAADCMHSMKFPTKFFINFLQKQKGWLVGWWKN